MAESRFISWPAGNPLWELSYTLGDYAQPEGIAIHRVRYKGRQVLYKASLPSLRVQYNGDCGPYKDPLHYNNAQPWPNGKRVRVYDYNFLGFGFVSLESYHTIGAYRLRQRWTFTNFGTIVPRLFSAGLQCNDDHRHHAYWRFDFDINTASNDAIYEFNSTTGNIGYGPGWHKEMTETSRVKSPGTNRHWAVMDKGAQNGSFIIPGANDGSADAFARRDAWLMRYRAAEDKQGNQGNAAGDDLDVYINKENLDGRDVVFWYCGHLGHHAHDGGDEWHETGPRLDLFRW